MHLGIHESTLEIPMSISGSRPDRQLFPNRLRKLPVRLRESQGPHRMATFGWKADIRVHLWPVDEHAGYEMALREKSRLEQLQC
jgi:hypothetical protein